MPAIVCRANWGDAAMHDRHLDVFLLVAERGSFAKAAAELYLSSHAVIKQINLLELNCLPFLGHRK